MKLKFKIFYALICLSTASVAVAQDGLILTAEENKEWIENLKAEEELSQQLSLLKSE